ncbi:MAG: hypothetical protein C4336_04085 [Armatimonadota bacterium]
MRLWALWLGLWFWCVGLGQGMTVSALQEVQAWLNRAREQSGLQRERSLEQAIQALKTLPAPAFEPLRDQLDSARQTLDTDTIVQAQRTVGFYLRWARAQSAPPNPQALKRQLERIFAEPDMQIVEKTLWERIGDASRRALMRLMEFLKRIFGRIGGVGGVNIAPVFQWLVIGLVVLAIALFASYLLGKVEIRRVKPPTPAIFADLPEDARVLTAAEWHALAQNKAQSGDWALAVRALYMGLLRLLHENKLLAYDPALTNWEHLERLRKTHSNRPATASLMTEVYPLLLEPTLTFDRIGYGGVAASASDYQVLETVFHTLQQKVRGGSHA